MPRDDTWKLGSAYSDEIDFRGVLSGFSDWLPPVDPRRHVPVSMDIPEWRRGKDDQGCGAGFRDVIHLAAGGGTCFVMPSVDRDEERVRGSMICDSRRGWRVLLVGAALWLVPLQAVVGQVKGDHLPPTFHQTVRRVVEDVVVTDAHGRPIAGLHRRDFKVSEDGVPQRILSFEAHTLRPLHEELAPAHLPAGVLVDLPSKPVRGPLYVLVYDMLHMSADDEMYAREQIVRFIRSKPEGTRFAVFALSDGIHLVQGFTDHRKLLFRAVNPKGSTPHVPKAFLYKGNYLWDNPQAKALGDIADYVAGLPGRKNVIWMADGLDLPLFADIGTAQQERAARHLLQLLAKQQISLYPVDVAGVAGKGLIEMTRYQMEDEMARKTGGRAYYSTNDLVDALDKATEAGAVYYTLTYQPTNEAYNGEYRHIAIGLTHGHYQLWYRPGYYARSQRVGTASGGAGGSGAGVSPPDTLYVYVRHGMPMSHGVVFLTRLRRAGAARMATPPEMAMIERHPAYFRTRRRGKRAAALSPVRLYPYEVDYRIPTRQFRGRSPVKHAGQDTLEFVAAAYDRNGLLLNGTINHAAPRVNAATHYYRAVQDVEVPQGAASICLAVRDVDTGKIGNLEVALRGRVTLPARKARNRGTEAP